MTPEERAKQLLRSESQPLAYDVIARAIREAVAAEREACARTLEKMAKVRAELMIDMDFDLAMAELARVRIEEDLEAARTAYPRSDRDHPQAVWPRVGVRRRPER